MRILKFECFIILVFSLSSCLSTKDLLKKDIVIENGIGLLDGTYSNIAENIDNPKSEPSLYLLLFKKFHSNSNNPETVCFLIARYSVGYTSSI